MAVTIKDVAQEAGVSFSTVSKVVNGSPEISEKTVAKVKEVMKRLDFIPNVRASSFKRRSTRSVAFLAGLRKGEAFANPHMFEILSGAHHGLARKGYSVTLIDVSEDEQPGDAAKAAISAGAYDGIIVHGSALNRGTAEILTRAQFPYIVIGKPRFENQLSWLDTNNVLAGDIAARCLANYGAKEIAFICGSREQHISIDRLEGVRSAANELGVPLLARNILYTDSSVEQGYSTTVDLLKRDNRPDGIVCANSVIAIGALKAVHESGCILPTDLQMITFDDQPYSQLLDPALTVVNIDTYDLGEQVASQLLKKIRNPALHVQSYITLPQLIARGTTKMV